MDSVKNGDTSGVKKLISRGVKISFSGEFGNTPLHAAFYEKDVKIVEALIGAGASNKMQNEFGLVPSQMWQLTDIERLITNTSLLIDKDGNWQNRGRARKMYDELRNHNDRVVIAAISTLIIESTGRLNTLILGVKLGIHNSEVKLNSILARYGNKPMAEDFLNSGSEKLADGGRRWAKKNGYTVSTGHGSHRSKWGQF